MYVQRTVEFTVSAEDDKLLVSLSSIFVIKNVCKPHAAWFWCLALVDTIRGTFDFGFGTDYKMGLSFLKVFFAIVLRL